MSNFHKQFYSPVIFAVVVGTFFSLESVSATALIDLGLLGVDSATSARIDARVEGEGQASSTDKDAGASLGNGVTTTLEIRVSRSSLIDQETASTSILNPSEVARDSDLRAFAFGAIQSDPNVEEVNFERESVEVVYKQKGHLLALLPINFLVRARANANGDVEVEYPWYSFLTIDNSEQIETEINMAVDIAVSQMQAGRVEGEGSSSIGSQFSPKESAIVAQKMLEVLKASFLGEGTAAASLD